MKAEAGTFHVAGRQKQHTALMKWMISLRQKLPGQAGVKGRQPKGKEWVGMCKKKRRKKVFACGLRTCLTQLTLHDIVLPLADDNCMLLTYVNVFFRAIVILAP